MAIKQMAFRGNSNQDTQFEELDNDISKWINLADNVLDSLEAGASAYVEDANKLPKPYRKVMKAGYQHLNRSFSYLINKKDISVGWGKYYGPMIEKGTVKFNKEPHLQPLWERNKDKYYNIMINAQSAGGI